MHSLFLIRAHVLTNEEVQGLPVGCFPIAAEHPLFVQKRIVAQTQIRASVPLLLKMAFDMGQAVPNAAFGFEEGALEDEESSHEYSFEEASLEEVEPEEVEQEPTWYERVELGDLDGGLESLAQVLPITQEDQIIISRFFASKDAQKMVFVCRAARKFQWKSMALKLRVGLRHPDPQVRCAVVQSIGLLAGPSLSPVIQICTRDADESVRNAAVKALRQLKRY